MGKRVLAGLIVAWAIVASTAAPKAQPQEPSDGPQPFTAGRFLTADDYEHVVAALEYINLTPGDLSFEKKHIDHRFRLKVADHALDHPLDVPLITERAADNFRLASPPTTRCMAAAELFDIGTKRWTIDEMRKDEAGLTDALKEVFRIDAEISEHQVSLVDRDDPGAYDRYKERMEALRAERDVALVAADQYRATALFGEAPQRLLPEGVQAEAFTKTLGQDFTVAAESMTRGGWRLSRAQAADLASRIGSHVAHVDLPLPGAKPLPEAEDLFELGGRAHLDGILNCASRVGHVLSNLANAWRHRASLMPDTYVGSLDHGIKGVTGGVVAAWESKWGRFVIGGTGPNTYEGDDFIGIIDLGGDDVYRGRIACGIGLEGHAPISFVLDLSGNDRYEGGDFTQGFGFLGVGILWDLGGGDDTYIGRFCAQGAGLCGYGELYDDGGNDIYIADSFAQGAGMFGYGHLIDAAGNDSYRGARYVQGFAQVMGVGVLTDGAGNDVYYAGGKYLHQPLWNDRYQSLSQGFAIGNRNSGTGGGVALLLDQGDGNDVFHADIYGQGSSYWFSLGMLVSEGGNNTYTLGQYGQGAGIHLSTGILVDLAGNDTYSMGVGLGQGAAHDWGVGWLIDRAGNDLYQGNGQGMGLNFSVGILLDCAGNDAHSSADAGNIGKGHNNDISLLIDLAGKDFYSVPGVLDGRFTKRGRHALVYDVPEGWFIGIDASTLPTVQDPAPDSVKVQHILISWTGASDRVTLKQPRTKDEAIALRDAVLKQSRTKGADWAELQVDHNEDSAPHNTYDVSEDAPLVKPFKDTSLKLGVGQIDWCESQFGFHIIKRIE